MKYEDDAEISDDTIGRVLFSPLFTQGREEPGSRGQAYHSLEESLLPSQSLFVCHVRTVKPSRDSENEQIRILLERRKEQIVEQRFRNMKARPLTHWTDLCVSSQLDQWKEFVSTVVTAHEADLLCMKNFFQEISKKQVQPRTDVERSNQTLSRATRKASCLSVSGQTSFHHGSNGMTKISKRC